MKALERGGAGAIFVPAGILIFRPANAKAGSRAAGRVKLSASLRCYTGMETDSGSKKTRPDPLARRLADGDPGAPRELVQRHHAELYRYARALTDDASAAEDAVQAAFERAFAALGKYSTERIADLHLRPWLYRIALNVVRNARRDGRREVSVPEPGEHLAVEPGSRDEALLDALDALKRLPERQRVAVTLRYLEDLSYAGISAATDWPENTCKTLVRRGIGKLNALLADETNTKGDA